MLDDVFIGSFLWYLVPQLLPHSQSIALLIQISRGPDKCEPRPTPRVRVGTQSSVRPPSLRRHWKIRRNLTGGIPGAPRGSGEEERARKDVKNCFGQVEETFRPSQVVFLGPTTPIHNHRRLLMSRKNLAYRGYFHKCKSVSAQEVFEIA